MAEKRDSWRRRKECAVMVLLVVGKMVVAEVMY